MLKSLSTMLLLASLLAPSAYAQTAVANANIVSTVAVGVGRTEDEALKNAYSNAVHQVIGTLISSETLVKNNQLVQDKILTFSRGYIETARNVAVRNVNGLFEVTIEAQVRKAELFSSAQSNNLVVAQAEFDGASAHAQIVSAEENKKNNQQYVKDTLESVLVRFLRKDLYILEVGSPEVIKDKSNETETTLRVKFTLKIDEKKFQLLSEQSQKILEGLAKDTWKKYIVSSQNNSNKNIYHAEFRGFDIFDIKEGETLLVFVDRDKIYKNLTLHGFMFDSVGEGIRLPEKFINIKLNNKQGGKPIYENRITIPHEIDTHRYYSAYTSNTSAYTSNTLCNYGESITFIADTFLSTNFLSTNLNLGFFSKQYDFSYKFTIPTADLPNSGSIQAELVFKESKN